MSAFSFGGVRGFISESLDKAEVRAWIGQEAVGRIGQIVNAESGRLEELESDCRLVHGDFNPSNVGRGGTDWMDLAEDNCTMFWTVEDQNVRIYDVCNDLSLGVFNVNPLPHTFSFGLRILPDGGILVANTNVVVRLDAGGNQIQTYDAPGENFWFSLNLAPGCHEFWSGGLETGKAYRFDIESGDILEVLDTGGGEFNLGGLIIKGKCLACVPLCDQRTQGFWRRVCKKPHPEELNGVDPYVDDVVALGSPIFDGFDAGDICDLMAVSPPENDPCRKARRQFAAILLNIASDRLTTCQGITDGSTVQDAIDEIKTLLASGSDDDCKEAQGLAAEINEGTALVDCNLRFSSPTRVDISLSKNSPNPFSSTTTIHYILPAVSSQQSAINNPTRVRLAIYDITGRVVRTLVDGVQEVGSYTVEWNGKNSREQEVPNGIYFYRLQMGDYTATKKLILLR
ncbi:T9SS type A sorting domain-containing protein [candidate division TA06 bacterium]|nr:T9SS type A sorting domain-containing protein [candidate division TA06 bacterium]